MPHRKAYVTCIFLSLLAMSKAFGMCEEALLTSTFSSSKAVHTDDRLATLVTDSVWQEASKTFGANAVLYGVPVGASFGEYQKNVSQHTNSLQQSLTHDEQLSIAWSGLDPNAPSAYKNCLDSTTMQGPGLHGAVVGATDNDIQVRIHWFLAGQPTPASVSWQGPSNVVAGLPTSIPQGDTILVIPRPTSAFSLVGNAGGYTTGAMVLYPFIPEPVKQPTPTPAVTPPPPANPSGWYGFVNSRNKDRENELRNNCTGNKVFARVTAAGDFNALCTSVGLKCNYVCDWQGNTKPCNQNPNDGSRLAMCQ